MNKSDLIATREGLSEDENFIYHSWLTSLYYGDKSDLTHVPKDIFMANYHDIIENLLEISTIRVAVLKEDPSVLLGYVVLNKDETALHYAYCKKPWRNIGLIKGLVGANVKTVTELTDIGRSYIKNHPTVVYNPYAKEIIECQIKNELKKMSSSN